MNTWLCVVGVKQLFANGARPFFQIVLLLIFLYFFGWPIIETYAKKEVMVVEKIRNSQGIPVPAITVAAFPQEEESGKCYDLEEGIEECIATKTLNRSDILKGVLLGYDTRRVINLTQNMFIEDSNQPWSGRYYTLNLPLKIGPSDTTDQLYLFFANTTFFTQVFIHDPRFFFLTDNIDALPIEIATFKTRASYSHFYHLDLTEMHELNIPSDPCNTDPNYNFRTCVKKSVSQQVDHAY